MSWTLTEDKRPNNGKKLDIVHAFRGILHDCYYDKISDDFFKKSNDVNYPNEHYPAEHVTYWAESY